MTGNLCGLFAAIVNQAREDYVAMHILYWQMFKDIWTLEELQGGADVFPYEKVKKLPSRYQDKVINGNDAVSFVRQDPYGIFIDIQKTVFENWYEDGEKQAKRKSLQTFAGHFS